MPVLKELHATQADLTASNIWGDNPGIKFGGKELKMKGNGIAQKFVANQLRDCRELSTVAEDTTLHDVLIESAENTAKSLRQGHKLMWP